MVSPEFGPEFGPYHPVRSVGYAYGLHTVDEKRSIVVRGFQGYVVSGLADFKPVGYSGAPFAVYELSFAAPRGLSGAPLLNATGTVCVHGVVIGNSETRMVVFRSAERLEEQDQITTIEQHEALTLGVAITETQAFALNSQLLGVTLGEHLASHDLLLPKGGGA